MSQIVNMLDAKSSLSRLVHDLETGGADEFIIARNGRPAARLVPLLAVQADRSRRIGVAKSDRAAIGVSKMNMPDQIACLTQRGRNVGLLNVHVK